VSEQSVDEVRATRADWRRDTTAGITAVYDVEDRLIGDGDNAFPIRVYRPSADSGLPAAVYFHGGGWVMGDLDHSDILCRSLCMAAECVVVNVAYRLAPEHRFPTAAQDAVASLRFIAAQAGKLGIDTRCLAV